MAHTLTVAGIKSLEFLFAAGLIGSCILVILTSIEDFREVFHRESDEEPAPFAGD
jgi:hypothetical protein